MTIPVRLRLSRRRSFDLAAHARATNGLPAVDVSRPGPLGNPFVVGRHGTASYCVGLHRSMLIGCLAVTVTPSWDQLKAAHKLVAELVAAEAYRGHNVACWCALDAPCHSDNLLDACNAVAKRPIARKPVTRKP